MAGAAVLERDGELLLRVAEGRDVMPTPADRAHLNEVDQRVRHVRTLRLTPRLDCRPRAPAPRISADSDGNGIPIKKLGRVAPPPAAKSATAKGASALPVCTHAGEGPHLADVPGGAKPNRHAKLVGVAALGHDVAPALRLALEEAEWW